MPLWKRLCCLLGLHGGNRTEHFGERRCECGGSYWGHVVYGRHERYLGNYKWYSAKKIAQIKASGEYNDLVCGIGKYSQES
jgi:hypothetical protein